MTCSKCDQAPTGKHGLCRLHWNEYQRDYEKRAAVKRDKESRHSGFTDGVSACVQFLRSTLGDRAATGFQSAQLLERGITGAEPHELTQRRAFLESMRR